jgi:uncharacterized protein YPO0396
MLTDLDGGFRLKTLEMFNWGTFDKKVWRLHAAGETVLLTGANGSGKSTMVDALLTLLVPANKRNYNLAAGVDNKKRDRSEKTYVEGHYGRGEGIEGILKVRNRPEDCTSILLAVFANPESEASVSIAQVFWFDQAAELKKFFIVTREELAIERDFLKKEQSLRQLKADLKASGHSIYDNFKAYSTDFRSAVGLRSEKAIDLFNQIVTIKSLGVLNDFVRENMLEYRDRHPKIEELDRNFSNLTETYQEITKAREQVKLLEPIQQKAEELAAIEESLQQIQGLIHVVPYFFLDKRRMLLGEEVRENEWKLSTEKDRLSEATGELFMVRGEEKKLFNAIENNDTRKRIADLQRQKENHEGEIARRTSKWKSYSGLAARLSLQVGPLEGDYLAAFKAAKEMQEKNSAKRDGIRHSQIEFGSRKRDLEIQIGKITDELNHLKISKNLLPGDQSRTRHQISRTLGIPEKFLYYACELIQVKPSAKEWTGAIERLLHNFGLRLLVPEKFYEPITDYVNSTHLNARLVYSRMIPGNVKVLPKDKDEVFYKLEIKPDVDSETRDWLESQILREFGFVCCELNRFKSEERALTKEGLVKSGRIRHEKDDRRSINDKRNFILGWNNLEKIQALEEEFAKFGLEVYALDGQLQTLRKQEEQGERERADLVRFLDFTQFSEIDTESLRPMLAEVQRQLMDLENQSEEYIQLKNQIEACRIRLQDLEIREKEITKEVNNLDYRIAQIQTELKSIESSLGEISVELMSVHAEELSTMLGDPKFELAQLPILERQVYEQAEKRRIETSRQKETAGKELVARMSRFTAAYPEDSSREELEPRTELALAFEKVLEKIRKERLPDFESRFKSMMDDKVSKQILEFKADLEDDVEDIKDRINELNESLRFIDYVKDRTYIQLNYLDTKNREIVGENGLKQTLKDCIPNVGDSSLNEEKFKNIRNLLSRLKAENETDRWARLVTDTRNWLDFQVKEYDRETGKVKEVYDSSAGKSGGQTVKLAYTIIAAAIYYQFGLGKSMSFRFVVIDEMFNNLDNQNSRFAMDLFQKLKLQLLVVTPMDKIKVVEPYIASVHFVRINADGNRSQVFPISKEKLHEEKKSAMISHATISS